MMNHQVRSNLFFLNKKNLYKYIYLIASESVARTAALLSTYGKKKKKTSNERYQWLRECLLAFSPTLNLLVTAFDQQIVVSTG